MTSEFRDFKALVLLKILVLLDCGWFNIQGEELVWSCDNHTVFTLSLSLATGVPQPAHLLLLSDGATAAGRGGGAGGFQAVAQSGDTESGTQ